MVGLTKKMALEERHVGGKGVSHGPIWGETIQREGTASTEVLRWELVWNI